MAAYDDLLGDAIYTVPDDDGLYGRVSVSDGTPAVRAAA